MRRRCCLIFITVLCCCMLSGCMFSGCAITNMFRDIANRTQREDVLDTIANDSNYPMSQSTKDKQNKVLEASSKLTEQDSGWQFWRWGSDTYCCPWFEDAQDEKLNRKYNKANNAYNDAKSTDKVFQGALDKEGKDNQWNVKKPLSAYAVPIILIIIIVLIVILKLNSKKTKVKVEQAPPVVIAPPAQPVGVIATKDVNMSDKQRRHALEAMCAKVGVDADTVLAQCGGDMDKAFLEVSLMT